MFETIRSSGTCLTRKEPVKAQDEEVRKGIFSETSMPKLFDVFERLYADAK